MDIQKTADYYDEYYFAHCCGSPYERDEQWMGFFSSVAERIVADICPQTVLDAGCAMGFLVETLRQRGIEAWGVDISEYAIQKAHSSIQPYCWVGSVTNAFPKKYDLITCIEVLEHLTSQEAEQAIINFCQYTDDILFSSTPFDYKEASHFHVQPPEYWAEQFARQGFIRDIDFDASFITPWAVRFCRNPKPWHRVLRGYERKFWLLWKENQDVRSSTVELYNQIATGEQSVQKLNAQVAELHLQLQSNQAELEQSLRQTTLIQSQLQQTQIQLEQMRLQWQQTKAQRESLQSQLQYTQTELEQSQSQLQYTQTELEQSQTAVAAMKTSKFWQLRTAWFWVKRKVGLPTEPKPIVPIQVETPIENVQLAEAKFDYAPSVVETIPGILYSKDINYQKWLNKNYPRQADLRQMAETAKILSYKPVISVIMPVFNPPERFLREAIESVLNQVYPYWELCIADDASTQAYIKPLLQEYAAKDTRIKVVFRSENGHISYASNSALEIATGEFVALLDHDDVITPNALYEVAFLLNQQPEADMIYSDEDKIDENNQVNNPYFKPDWSPDSFLSRMYTCHLGTYRRSLLTKIGGFRAGYEGSQDYDLVLRLTEKTNKIFHISKILYSWRIHPQSASSGAEAKPYAYIAAEKALTDALSRRGEQGTISGVPGLLGLYRVRYQIKEYKLVSIIVPTKDLGETLDKCLKSIFEKSTYPNYEVIVIDNGSTEEYTEQVINYWKTKEQNRFRCCKLDIPFNYSKINNYAVTQTKGDYLLFLNNDTEVISPDWIDAMVEQAQRSSIGVVGALLLYPDDTIQHAGIVLGIGDVAGHSHKKFPATIPGYYGQVITVNNYSAVTGACLMCRRELYENVGGFEEKLAVAYNDVDFCLELVSQGYRNVYLPHVVLYHYESKSRGREDNAEKLARFAQEAEYMQQKWKQIIENDPCYSPHLTKKGDDYSINI